MPAQAFQSDDQIAATLTHIRNSWGNQASPVTPEMVAALRSEVGKPPLTVSDLIIPPGIDPPAACIATVPSMFGQVNPEIEIGTLYTRFPYFS